MSESPLAEVVRDRRVNRILEAVRQAVRERRPILIRPRDVDYIRRIFGKGLALGERKLHELAGALLSHFEADSAIHVLLAVWGRCPLAHHEQRVVNEVDFTPRAAELMAVPDHEMASAHAPVCPECGAKCIVVASFVRRRPQRPVTLLMVQTRIKNTSNLCYKIADLVFDIDYMFQRDKIHNDFGQVVTDIYGIKAVTRTEEDIARVAAFFRSLKGAAGILEKDYTGERRKKSGFEAFKTIIKRDGQAFEIQIQSQRMFDTEQYTPSASHKSYREIQTAERRRLGQEYVSLYRALSQLFATPEKNYCSIEYIEIVPSGLDDEF